MLASTLSCTLVSQTTKWQIFLTRYLFSPWKLSSHTKCWMRNFIRCPSQFLISCAYPSLSRVLPKKKQCNLTFSSEPQQLNPRNGPSHCHQKPPVRSLKQDLCLLIHLWGTFFHRNPTNCFKILRYYSEQVQQFLCSFVHKRQHTELRKEKKSRTNSSISLGLAACTFPRRSCKVPGTGPRFCPLQHSPWTPALN